MKKSNFIYSLEYPEGNVRYIGKTENPEARFRKHINDSSKHTNSHKMAWINGLLTSGVMPKMVILDTVPSNEVNFWERHYIWLYRSWGFRLTNGTFGGDGLHEPTKELKDKISESLKETYKNGLNTWNKGLKASDEHKEKLSKAKKLKFKPVLQFDLSGNFIDEYTSLAEATQKTGYSKTTISKVCLGKNHTAFGFIWTYKHKTDDNTVKNIIAHLNKENHRNQYPTLIDVYKCTIIGQWPSLKEASISTGLSRTLISHSIKDKYTPDGKFWCYKADMEGKTLEQFLDEAVFNTIYTTLRINPETGEIMKFLCPADAAKFMNTQGSTIVAASNMKAFGSHGYIWIKRHLLDSGATDIETLMRNYKTVFVDKKRVNKTIAKNSKSEN